MNNKFKKTFSAMAAAAVTVSACIPFLGAVGSVSAEGDYTQFPYSIEGEALKEGDASGDMSSMNDATLWTSIYENQLPGYTGDGFAYLTGSALNFEVSVPEDGMYNISARVAQILDKEGNGRMETVSVNGSEYSKNVPYLNEWTDFDFGVVRLKAGTNRISFLNKYGYMAIDNVSITVAEKHDYSLATDVTCDANATPETKALMKYLKSVYGSHIIAGQQEIYGGGHNDNYEWENEFLEDLTGKVPAIRGVDFMNYNPLYGWDDGTTERCIEWATERNGIVTASWHINVPIDFDNYTVGDAVDWTKCSYKNYQASGSTFNTANVLEEGTKEREYFEAAMEDLAEQLLKLQEANVPVIWRPLHEAQGNEGNYGDGTAWFWWGDRGAEVYKELWKLLYTTLTEKYGLHNLIWEYNSYDYSNSATWYPGDEYVDIVAYDKYNVEYNRGDGNSSGPNLLAISAKFNSLFNLTGGKKMVAMAENDTVPALDNLLVEDAGWLYFCPWYDGGEDGGTAFLGENYQDHAELTKMYQSEYCITLDELPSDLYVYSESGTTEPSSETTTEDDNIIYGDADLSGVVTIDDVITILCYSADKESYPLSDEALNAADVYQRGDGVSSNDAVSDQKLLTLQLDKLPESYL